MVQKLLLFVFMVFQVGSIFSQVSDSKILSDIKAHDKNVKTVKLEGKNISEKTFENGAWVNYMRRSYRSVSTTKYPGVTYHYYGAIQYKKRAAAYSYDKLLVGDGYYEGFAAPNEEEIRKYIDCHIKDFFGNYYYKIIGDKVPEISLVEGTKWKWHTPKSVSGEVKCTFTVPVSYTELEKAEHFFNLRLYSDNKIAIDNTAKWNGCNVSEQRQKKIVISTSTHTADEVRSMPTLEKAAQEKIAQNELNSLPRIDPIPIFQTSTDLFLFTHRLILTKNAAEIRTYLYNLVSKNCRSGKLVNMMTEFAQNFIDKIVTNEDNYKKTYCQYPIIKHEQNGMIEFYDKEKLHYIRMSAVLEDNIWRINSIDYYPAKLDEVSRMAQNTAACDENKPAKPQKYSLTEAGFSIVMPKEPSIKKPANSSDAYQMTCVHEGSEFIVIAEPLEKQLIDALAQADVYQETALKWCDQLRVNLGAASSKPVTWVINNTKGFKTQWRTSSDKIRIYSVILDDMFYKIMVSNAKNSPTEDQFFNSFVSSKKNKFKKSVSFKVGDKVYVRTTKGKMKAKVIEMKQTQCKVKYNDPRYGTQWVANSNLTKQ